MIKDQERELLFECTHRLCILFDPDRIHRMLGEQAIELFAPVGEFLIDKSHFLKESLSQIVKPPDLIIIECQFANQEIANHLLVYLLGRRMSSGRFKAPLSPRWWARISPGEPKHADRSYIERNQHQNKKQCKFSLG